MKPVRFPASRIWLLALVLCLGSVSAVRAGGPLAVVSGNYVLWPDPGQIPYNPDRGTLGILNQAEAHALLDDALSRWSNVPSSSVQFVNKGLLPVNVTASNYQNYIGKSNDGISPVIFDTDGSIIAALYGQGNQDFILGYAGAYRVGNNYVEGEAVINGLFMASEEDMPMLKATLVHEFGHYIGLDHTQINSFAANNGITEDDIYLPTMYPTATDDDTSLADLNPDDVVWLTELYLAPGLVALGAITGTIRNSGNMPFNGANVTLRDAADPLFNAVSCVAGFRNTSATQGVYLLPRLVPGRYTVGVDEILPDFTGGSAIGPFDPPRVLPGPPEFHNGSFESNSDNPEDAETLAIAWGQILSGIDIRLNAAYPPLPTINEVEPNHTRAQAQILTSSVRVLGSVSNADAKGDIGIPWGEGTDFIEDLYFFRPGKAATITVTLTPQNTSVDLDLIAFLANNTIYALQATSPNSQNNGVEKFGPMEIPPEGIYIGVTYWDFQGAGSTNYTLDVQAVRFPIGIDAITPSRVLTDSTNLTLTVRGSGFLQGATAAFPGSNISVNSVEVLNDSEIRLSVSIPPEESSGLKTLEITNPPSQKGRLQGGLEVDIRLSSRQWERYE